MEFHGFSDGVFAVLCTCPKGKQPTEGTSLLLLQCQSYYSCERWCLYVISCVTLTCCLLCCVHAQKASSPQKAHHCCFCSANLLIRVRGGIYMSFHVWLSRVVCCVVYMPKRQAAHRRHITAASAVPILLFVWEVVFIWHFMCDPYVLFAVLCTCSKGKQPTEGTSLLLLQCQSSYSCERWCLYVISWVTLTCCLLC